MKVVERFYLTSQKEEIESIPDFSPISSTTLNEKPKPQPRDIAEILFITTETTTTSNAATPFGVLIKLYRRRPVYRRIPIRHRTIKLLIGYRYELHRVIYLPPIQSSEVIDMPKFILDHVDGLENFLLPLPR